MRQIFGEFNNEPVESVTNSEFLMLRFSPDSRYTKRRWENNGLSADFLADYLSAFFPGNDDDEREEELQGAVSYIANELLENAMKFSSKQFNYPVSLQVHLFDDHLMLSLSNSIPIKNVEGFQLFIQELLNNDPQELYRHRITNIGADKEMTSKLGLLTMMNDYDAKLGWKFENYHPEKGEKNNKRSRFWEKLGFLQRKRVLAPSQKSEIMLVTTTVRLAV